MTDTKENNNKMIEGSYYVNNNGKVSKGKITDKNADEIFGLLPSFSGTLEDLFLGSGRLADDWAARPPRRSNRLSCDASFPPSSKWVDPETKILHIDIAACGVSDDEFRVDLENDNIIVQFGRKKDEKKLYDFKGLKLVSDEKLSFAFDPRFHDASTATCKLDRGLLSIEVLPREEVRPVKKCLGGSLVLEDKSTEEADVSDDEGRD